MDSTEASRHVASENYKERSGETVAMCQGRRYRAMKAVGELVEQVE